MGKGDKKTKKGKITKGSFGVNRPKKKKRNELAQQETKQETKGIPTIIITILPLVVGVLLVVR